MMPPADRIHEQNDQDPGRVEHTRQEAGSNDFLAVSPALSILELDMKGLSVAFYSTRIINRCPVVWVIGRKLELAE